MIFAEPRFATAILQDKDLAGVADCNEELDRVVATLLERRSDIKTLFLVASCPSEVIKLDLANAAERLGARFSATRFLAYDGSGINTTFTEGEDSCLESMVDQMPRETSPEPGLLVVGTLPDIVEDQLRRLLASMIDVRVEFLPGRKSSELPSINPATHFILAQPYLGRTSAALTGSGATRIEAGYPLGAEGTRRWLMAIANAFKIPASTAVAAIEMPYQRAKRALAAQRKHLEGKRVAFLPDSQLEIPMARFLSEECGMTLVELATPLLNKELMADELAHLPTGSTVTEGQDVEAQLDRIRTLRPDLTVCGLGLANPLEAEGLRTKWSIELQFSPTQGFDQAGDLAALFARPLIRNNRLRFATHAT